MTNSLRALEGNLENAESLLTDGDLSGAQKELQEAVEVADRAAGLADRPSLAFSSIVPRWGRDLRAVRALARAGSLASRGALEAVNGLAELGPTADEAAGTLFSDGQVHFEPLASTKRSVLAAGQLLNQALEEINDAPDPSVARVQRIVRDVFQDLAEARARVDDASNLFTLLPDLFAKGSERSYLLVFQSLGEARGTGGVITFYGVLDAEDGRLELRDVGPIRTLPNYSAGIVDPPVSGPDWLEKSYGPQGALTQWQQANLTPNFAVAADVLLQMYERHTGDALDGVVAMDPVMLEQTLSALEPIEIGDTTITQSNVVQLTMEDSYQTLDDASQDDFVLTLIGTYWERIASGEADVRMLAEGLGSATKGGHLRLHVARDSTEERLAELASGVFPEGDEPNVQLVYHQNYGNNKVDYYMRRRLDIEVALDPAGNATVNSSITIQNLAPRAASIPPTELLGIPGQRGVKEGWNKMLLSLLAPRGSRDAEITIDGQSDAVPFSFEDSSYPVFWDLLQIPPQESVTVKVSYVVPHAVGPVGDFRFTLVPQSLAHPDEYSLEVRAPESTLSTSEGDIIELYEEAGQLKQARTVSLQLSS